jgi:hypothetical protein
MINSNKIYFITSPLGQYNAWCLEKLETLLHFNNNNKIYFRFGTMTRLDLVPMYNAYDRVSLIINDQISNFHNTNFFYYGWETISCLDKLYENFPGSEFLLVVNNFDNETLETLEKGKMGKLNDPTILPKVAEDQKNSIKNFINGKIYTDRVRERKSENGDVEKSITTYHLKN